MRENMVLKFHWVGDESGETERCRAEKMGERSLLDCYSLHRCLHSPFSIPSACWIACLTTSTNQQSLRVDCYTTKQEERRRPCQRPRRKTTYTGTIHLTPLIKVSLPLAKTDGVVDLEQRGPEAAERDFVLFR